MAGRKILSNGPGVIRLVSRQDQPCIFYAGLFKVEHALK